MRYREGQVHFVGKQGFSLLGILVSFRDQSKFYEVVVQGFSTQNAFQVQNIVQYVQKLITSDFPLVSRITIQSDNASAYSCADHIRFVYQLNISRPHFATIVQWVNSEAQKGKTRLDCHFSYVGLQFRKFVQARNDILTEVDIFAALKFDGGIRDTTAILLDMRSVNRPFKIVPAFQVNSATSQIHGIMWKMDEKKIEFRYFTSYDPCEVILESRKPSLMASGVISDRECVSSRFDHIGFPASPSIPSNSGLRNHSSNSPRENTIASILSTTIDLSVPPTVPFIPMEYSDGSSPPYVLGWGCKKRRATAFTEPVTKRLRKMFAEGDVNKAQKWSVDSAHREIIEGLRKHDWELRMKLLPTKLTSFCSTESRSRNNTRSTNMDGTQEKN